MLVTMKELLEHARMNKYGVAAANVFNDRTVRASFQVADSLKAPLIIACTPFVELEELAYMAAFYEKKYPKARIALNLDHGQSYDHAMRAIRCGFTSVMIDKSTLPYEENVREVKEVVKAAHSVGVTVEAELGHVGKGAEYEQTRDSGLTRREEAVSFVEETGVDCLAVAVGTSHGVYKGTPNLNFELLADLRNLLQIPLVLHGGSNTGDENLKKTIDLGIQKINLSTDLSTGFFEGVYRFARETGEIVNAEGTVTYEGNRTVLANQALEAGTRGWETMLRHYVTVFDSAGKA
ncbi:MAG TPA: class II fructose-bisphosphate aldolase [Anaerovoracaceae bacterium]|nr:class II fructose-bisphosphate aldolase [Anaerovoracaceae bacterium]